MQRGAKRSSSVPIRAISEGMISARALQRDMQNQDPNSDPILAGRPAKTPANRRAGVGDSKGNTFLATGRRALKENRAVFSRKPEESPASTGARPALPRDSGASLRSAKLAGRVIARAAIFRGAIVAMDSTPIKVAIEQAIGPIGSRRRDGSRVVQRGWEA